MLMTTETRVAFARRIGVHKSQITRAAQAGRVVLTAAGLVDVEASVERWYATKGGRDDVSARHAAARGGQGGTYHPEGENPAMGRISATAGATAATGGASPGSRKHYEAARVRFENERSKIAMSLRRGLRLTRAGVQREAAGLGGLLRAALERLIDETAPRLAVETDPAERRRLLRIEAGRIRRLVRGELPRALRRLRHDAKEAKEASA